jgi:hypothetical protein
MSVGDGARRDPIVEFHGTKVRERFSRIAINASCRDHPNAFDIRSRSPPLAKTHCPL